MNNARKSVIRISNQVQHIPVYTHSEKKNITFEIMVTCTSRRGIDCVAKTKALISCAVTAQLICAFVFTLAEIWVSYDPAEKRITIITRWLRGKKNKAIKININLMNMFLIPKYK